MKEPVFQTIVLRQSKEIESLSTLYSKCWFLSGLIKLYGVEKLKANKLSLNSKKPIMKKGL